MIPVHLLNCSIFFLNCTRCHVVLRRYVAQVISESTNQGASSRPFYSWLESCLRHKGEMVIIEASRAIVNMPDVTQRELQPAVTVLQLFLTSSKPVLRFAAVRTLNKVGGTCTSVLVLRDA